MKKDNKTKKQHYVPKMYLKNFTFDGVNCYTKNRKGEINIQDISDICKGNFIYELRDKNGKIINKNLIEDAFAKVENLFSTFLIDLFSYLNKIQNNSKIIYSENTEREMLGCLYAFLILKNPANMMHTKDMVDEVYNIKLTNIEAENFSIQNILILLKPLSKIMAEECDITIYRNISKIPFITASCPVVATEKNNKECTYMPLSSKYLIEFTKKEPLDMKEDKLIEIDGYEVQQYNEMFYPEHRTNIKLRNYILISEKENVLK